MTRAATFVGLAVYCLACWVGFVWFVAAVLVKA